jgi:hypothetical protein
LPEFVEWARVVRGSSLAHLGQVAAGISEIRASIDNQNAMRHLLERPYCLMLLAEAVMQADQPREALALCDEAQRIARETHGRSYENDIGRLQESIRRNVSTTM